MPWQCRLIDAPNTVEDYKALNPGDMWYAAYWRKPETDGDYKTFMLKTVLSPQYKTQWLDKRAPIIVVLPNGEHICPDHRFGKGDGSGEYKEDGWTVTGDAPNITVSPSINATGRYHGWLQDGILSDDVEGRTF